MIILVLLKKIFSGMSSPVPLFQNMWKWNHFLTFSYDCASFDHFQKIFFFFFLAMLLLIFKSLFGVVAWKCQIVKIWYFLEEHSKWKYSVFLFSSTKWSFLMTPWFATFCQICASFYWPCPLLNCAASHDQP